MFIISVKLFSANEKSLRNIRISPNTRRLNNDSLFSLKSPTKIQSQNHKPR